MSHAKRSTLRDHLVTEAGPPFKSFGYKKDENAWTLGKENKACERSAIIAR